MLSDDVIAFFESKGYQIPSMGRGCVFQGGHYGEPGLWQLSLYDPKAKAHIYETGYSAVEVVSKMVVRLGGEKPGDGGRTGALEAMAVARRGLRLAMSIAANSLRD